MIMETNKPDYLVLVNGEHRMPDGFVDTVEIIDIVTAIGENYKVEMKTYEAFMRLREDVLKNDGIQMELCSGFRTVEFQEELFKRYADAFGIDYANKYVAKPAHSEHNTGLGIDAGIMVDGKLYSEIEELLSVDDLFVKIHKKIAEYGFILRYPKGKEEITKIGYEPWHFRYLDSCEIAKEITDKGICLEEYYE